MSTHRRLPIVPCHACGPPSFAPRHRHPMAVAKPVQSAFTNPGATLSTLLNLGVMNTRWTRQDEHTSGCADITRLRNRTQAEHAAFAQLLQGPKADADGIIAERFPVPRLVDCDQHGSQARFLLTKLNPSATYNSNSNMGSDIIYTDDVSLQVFMDHLKKLAVQD